MADDEIEQTLHIAREVSLFRIPPAQGAKGHCSGSWMVKDKIFSGRLRMVAKGSLMELRIEDVNTGDLFCMCPVPYGKRQVVVEPTTDSSRYFVLRVEDPTTGRHAWLGMGFEQRSDAFDFNEAMVRHEKHVQRELAAETVHSSVASGSGATSSSPSSASSSPSSSSSQAGTGISAKDPNLQQAVKEIESLYKSHGDLSLKAGETIRVNVKKPEGKAGKPGLLSGALEKPLVPLVPLIPPPGGSGSRLTPGLVPPPPIGGLSAPPVPQAPASHLPGQQAPQQAVVDLLSDLTIQPGAPSTGPSASVQAPFAPAPAPPAPSAAASGGWAAFPPPLVAPPVAPALAPPAAQVAASTQDWATFE